MGRSTSGLTNQKYRLIALNGEHSDFFLHSNFAQKFDDAKRMSEEYVTVRADFVKIRRVSAVPVAHSIKLSLVSIVYESSNLL